MIEYRASIASERDDVIDFANYVFSQAHRPHDFKTLLPKVYGERADWAALAPLHYLAVRDGRIRALVACPQIAMRVAGVELRAGLVGTVSVHPYARGEGHMKALMRMMLDDQRARGSDLLMLGGQRQRYQYFGFEHAGTCAEFPVNAANLRHAFPNLDAAGIEFAPLDEDRADLLDQAFALYERGLVAGARPRPQFLDILRSWQMSPRAILREGAFAGYLCAGESGTLRELTLAEEALLPAVLKRWFERSGAREARLTVMPYEAERLRALRGFAERYSLGTVEMVNVLNWPRVLAASLALKNTYQPLRSGRATLSIEGEATLELCVRDGAATVREAPDRAAVDLRLSHLAAIDLLFSPLSALTQAPECFQNWLPLPIAFSGQDGF